DQSTSPRLESTTSCKRTCHTQSGCPPHPAQLPVSIGFAGALCNDGRTGSSGGLGTRLEKRRDRAAISPKRTAHYQYYRDRNAGRGTVAGRWPTGAGEQLPTKRCLRVRGELDR